MNLKDLTNYYYTSKDIPSTFWKDFGQTVLLGGSLEVIDSPSFMYLFENGEFDNNTIGKLGNGCFFANSPGGSELYVMYNSKLRLLLEVCAGYMDINYDLDYIPSEVVYKEAINV